MRGAPFYRDQHRLSSLALASAGKPLRPLPAMDREQRRTTHAPWRWGIHASGGFARRLRRVGFWSCRKTWIRAKMAMPLRLHEPIFLAVHMVHQEYLKLSI